MRRRVVITVLVGVPAAALIWWIASNTSWEEIQVPAPARGEARTNPFYAAQRFTEALGARTSWDRNLATMPPSDAVVVLSSWHWTLSPIRQQTLERWVELGGRLVVDDALIGGEAEFENWSGIRPAGRWEANSRPGRDSDGCISVDEQTGPERTAPPGAASAVLCDVGAAVSRTTSRDAVWALRDTNGLQAVRVGVGAGTVTRINAAVVRGRRLFDGDHGHVLVAASRLRRGDDVHFLSEADYPSLLSLLWQSATPVVVLALAVVALVLWRDGVRFGPLAALPPRGRRSLAEQIRGTGYFVGRYGSGHILHAAAIRAIDEAARRRVPGYLRMSREERTAAVARLTRVEPARLAWAFEERRSQSPYQVRDAVEVFETARRRIIAMHSRRRHERG